MKQDTKKKLVAWVMVGTMFIVVFVAGAAYLAGIWGSFREVLLTRTHDSNESIALPGNRRFLYVVDGFAEEFPHLVAVTVQVLYVVI